MVGVRGRQHHVDGARHNSRIVTDYSTKSRASGWRREDLTLGQRKEP